MHHETLTPPAALKHVLERFHDTVEGAIDPLGMMAPIIHSQLAWLAHPQELFQRLNHLSSAMWILQVHAWRRATGLRETDPVRPHEDDSRFADPVWTESATWDIVKESYLAVSRHVQDMLYATPGLSSKERRRAAFWWRKWLNAVAPTNFFTNPIAMQKAIESRGRSLLQGARNCLEDVMNGSIRMADPSGFEVGRNLATTPGEVVFRNRLVEVIHYAPTQPKTHAKPVVIITPWINKFYILDLNPKKSLVGYLLNQGLDVLITSWKNPDASMRDIGFDDYLMDGVGAAITVAREFSGSRKVHAVGYCIGGTALAIYLAWANRHFEPEEVPVEDWTLLTTLVDFQRPGDIEVFIDEASIQFITAGMARRGYLDGREMASAFRLLRSNSLIWHYVVHGWLYGETPPPFDVLYWNMDTTRMPFRMHAWYLRELYLNNRLIKPNDVEIAGETIDLNAIAQPVYVVAAEDDHIAPWQQTFRINNFVTGAKRFVLSSSGHILGIINPPVTPAKRRFWAAEAHRADHFDTWRSRAQEVEGSWWSDWMEWIKPRCGEMVDARSVANDSFPSLAHAPGSYVKET